MSVACCGQARERGREGEGGTDYFGGLWIRGGLSVKTVRKSPSAPVIKKKKRAKLKTHPHTRTFQWQGFSRGGNAPCALHHLVKILTADLLLTSTMAINHWLASGNTPLAALCLPHSAK